ncbi:NAD(P)H-dependent glycerol-3-phosphate dehydrogenase [Actimicrobium sp. CCI2.3]|uniref:NAD(P)H-dependent glycerol-3-phosphate dehydrogenase n=1 Tax=Actimicrobium sp. CCI2.3 TaxID=3048616 RepID=UPI002AB3B4C8|nr:NAD(P)H-dependent glycerol-3-phosphate dehydrogenase [Actimicrobium sp. CCI2.3]MDY7576378.1 NAD(P)H-dependent glycerol-3-phosphate dehydrogenase [Actimicrobium sp. CCI2.3]MEB0020418.1 NAD(P)H-dependent glycerol-3-phosphate dehydrogenase [Actimicrobium sp. CCI2.3]
MNITLLGAGAWGTALAVSLAERHAVQLWGRDVAAMRIASERRENVDYLPGITLPQSLLLTSDFDAAVSHCAASDSLLIVASSVAGLRPIVHRLVGRSPTNLVWLCKGFEENSGLLPHQIVPQVLGEDVPCGALSGPSFAMEVARGLPGALAIASASAALRSSVVQAIHGPQLRIYATDDVIGVEVGGAVKNILAIATGIVDGLGLGLNARAALITRGLAEITRLGVALGGRSETFMGLAGMGDLILTCTGDLSRNRKVGLALAQGKTLAAIEHELGHVAEGVRCAREVRTLAAALQIEMPITDAVAGVLFDGNAPSETVALLLAREARNEAA